MVPSGQSATALPEIVLIDHVVIYVEFCTRLSISLWNFVEASEYLIVEEISAF
jgi:hypothetical protein